MFTFLKKFKNEEDGAVTVDWVVLTAAVVGLSVPFIIQLKDDSNSLSAQSGQYMVDQNVLGAAGGNIQDAPAPATGSGG
jgi:hypothetical protein